MDDKTIALILNTRTDNIELRIKSACQDLIIDRMKRELEQLRNKEKKNEEVMKQKDSKCEGYLSRIDEYHKMEVNLTSELKVAKESLKRVEMEKVKLDHALKEEQRKKQKIRKSYQTLSRSLNIDEDNTDLKEALNELKEGLMN